MTFGDFAVNFAIYWAITYIVFFVMVIVEYRVERHPKPIRSYHLGEAAAAGLVGFIGVPIYIIRYTLNLLAWIVMSVVNIGTIRE